MPSLLHTLFLSLPLLLSLSVSAAPGTAVSPFALKQVLNFGAPASKAPPAEKKECSSAGSFFTFADSKNEAVCSSEKTRTSPGGGVVCPYNWSMHKSYKFCIPPKENCQYDCGEGYIYNKGQNKCYPVPGHCGENEWWHPRSSSCCSNQPEYPGPPPSPKHCPRDWYWSTRHKKCKPNYPRAPEPDCDDWSESGQCCNPGGHSSQKPTPTSTSITKPTHTYGNGGGHNGGGDNGGGDNGGGDHGGGHRKRENVKQSQSEQIRLVRADLNAMYCPAPLTACSILTPSSASPEWSYECIDTLNELKSCGGCLNEGGVDCTALPGARMTGCTAGQCEIWSCLSGYKLNEDNTECIRKG